jgi:hypothetical protein
VALIVSAQGDGRLVGATHVAIEALAPGERRQVELAVPTQPDLVVHGIVLQRGTREPVAGARITAEPSRDQGPSPVASTTNDGRFVLQVRSFATARLVCEHEDYGPVVAAAARGHERAIDALELLLDPAAALRVRLDGPGAGEAWSFRLAAQAQPRDLAQPEGSPVGGELVARVAWVEGAAAELRGLPARAPIHVVLSSGPREVWRSRGPLVLAPGEVRELEIPLGTASIAGTVREADGTPAAGELLRLLRTRADGHQLAESDPAARAARLIETDAEGAFAFDDLEVGTWLVGPVPDLDADPRRAPAPTLERVEVVPGAGVVRHDLVLARGLVLTGRVVGPDGAAIAGAHVRATSPVSMDHVRAITGADGAFVAGPLIHGTWTLRARHVDGRVTDAVDTAAGREDVVLVLHGPRDLEILVVDAERRPLRGAAVTVIAADGRGDASTQHTADDGTTTLAGVDAGPFHVAASATGPLFGAVRDVLPGPSAIVGVLEPAGSARVLFQGPGPGALLLVGDRGMLVQVAHLVAGRMHEIVGPVGEVDAQIHVGGRRHDRRLVLAREPGPGIVFDSGWR